MEADDSLQFVTQPDGVQQYPASKTITDRSDIAGIDDAIRF